MMTHRIDTVKLTTPLLFTVSLCIQVLRKVLEVKFKYGTINL